MMVGGDAPAEDAPELGGLGGGLLPKRGTVG